MVRCSLWMFGRMCRKKQHVKIDDMKEMPDLICSKAAVGRNYNSTRDNMFERLYSFRREKHYI